MKQVREKLSILEKVGYALGDTGSNIYFQIFLTFLLYFYTDVFGISAAAAGTMFLLSRLFDAVNDPFIGIIADRVNTRWGKYRPFILFFAIPLVVMGVITFTTPDLAETGKLVYAYITYNLLMIAYTLVNVPYASLMAVLTPNSMERVEVSSYRFVAVFLAGILINSTTLYLVEYFGQGNDQMGWQYTMGVFGVMAFICFFITFITTRERIAPPKNQSKEVKMDLSQLLANKAWVMIAGATVFQLIFIVMRNSSVTYYFEYYVLDQSVSIFGTSYDFSTTALISGFLAIGTALNILGALCTKQISKIFDKKVTYIAGLTLSSVFTGLFFFLRPDQVILMFLFQFVVSFAWGPVSVLQWAMYTDAADYGEWVNNRRVTGLLMAASLFALKIGLALGGALTGWILSGYGFVANVVQSADTITGIILLVSLFPAIFGIIGSALMLKYPLTNDTMMQIESELEERRERNQQE